MTQNICLRHSTKSMEQCSSEARVVSYSRNSPHLIRPEYLLLCSHQPVTCLCPQLGKSSLHLPSYFFKVQFNANPHPHLGLQSGLFPSSFPTNILYTHLFSNVYVTCLSHLIFYLISIIMVGDECKLLCNFYQQIATSFQAQRQPATNCV